MHYRHKHARSKEEKDHEAKILEQKKRDLENIFMQFDRNRDGSLDKGEIIDMLMRYHGNSPEEAEQIADELLATMDRDGNKELSMEEFAD